MVESITIYHIVYFVCITFIFKKSIAFCFPCVWDEYGACMRWIWSLYEMNMEPVGFPRTSPVEGLQLLSSKSWGGQAVQFSSSPFVATSTPLVFPACLNASSVGWLPWDCGGVVTPIVCPGDEICVSPVSLSADGDPASQVGPHIKTRGIAAPTNITHFLCCVRDRGARRFISRGSPPAIAFQPARRPGPQEPRKKSKCQSRRRRLHSCEGSIRGGRREHLVHLWEGSDPSKIHSHLNALNPRHAPPSSDSLALRYSLKTGRGARLRPSLSVDSL